MAKKGKTLPARKASRDHDSLLMRSAESLGRVIGSLQRQMRGGAERLSSLAEDAANVLHNADGAGKNVNGNGGRTTKARAAAARKTSRKTAARKTSARKP